MILSVRCKDGTQIDLFSLPEALSALQGDENITRIIMYNNSEVFFLTRELVEDGKFVIAINSVSNEIDKAKLTNWFPIGAIWESKTRFAG